MSGAIFSRVRVTEILSEKMSARAACCEARGIFGGEDGGREVKGPMRGSRIMTTLLGLGHVEGASFVGVYGNGLIT